MSELNFNARNVEPDTGKPDPVPAGWYNVIVDETDLKPTSDALGARLATRYSIIDGQYAGRKIFGGFNIKNSNPVAQEIAYKQLSALAHAVGVLDVKTSEMLHNIPLMVKVKVKPATEQYEASNEVTMFKAIGDAVTTTGGPSAPSAPQGFGTSAPSAPAGFGGGFGAPPPPPAPVPPPVKAGPKMTAKAQASYEVYIANNWTDALLIEHGLMEAPVAVAVPGPSAPPAQPWDSAPVSAPPAPVSAPPSAPPAPVAPSAPSAPSAPQQAQTAIPPWQQ